MLRRTVHDVSVPAVVLLGLRSLALATVLCAVYFLAARLSLQLMTSAGVAVFWPAAGVAAGVLIGLGPTARLPVVTGIIGATIAANLLGDRNIWSSMVFAACNAGEAVLVAALVERFFGSSFSLDRPHHVRGLIGIALIAAAASGIGGTLGYVFFHRTADPFTIWRNWFASDAIGIITVAPLVFELIRAARDPLPRREILEGTLALAILAAFSMLVVVFPGSELAAEVTIASLFPLLLWIAARYRPLFTAVVAVVFTLTIVWMTTFELGLFGDFDRSVEERIVWAQLCIVVQALCTLTIAALFAERRQSVADLQKSEGQLRDALAAANEANHAKSVFLAAASHDLRQPLQTLGLLQGTLKRRVQDGESRRLLGGIERAVDVMSGMLISLLDVNRLESGALRPVITDFPIHLLFDSLSTDYNGLATEKGLEWRVVRSAIWIRSDRDMLEEMIRNLLSNAVRYTDRGRILLGCRRIGDNVRIEIWDSGVGISGEHIPRIFDENYQISDDAHLGGFGLGLAIVKRLAKILGHHVGVTSTAGKGSGFSIEVPLGLAGYSGASTQPSSSVEDHPLSGAALIIEDEGTVRAALSSLLESYGLDVTSVATVDEALPLVASKSLIPDLIVSDYNLPGKMNGVESIKALRAALDHDVPAIVMTGDTRTEIIDKIAAHDVGLAIKPVHADEIRRLIDRLLC